MESFIRIILKYRKTVVLFFLVFTLVSALLQFAVPVNYNILDFLPQDALSTRAMKVMEAEFDEPIPNARVMLQNVSIQEVISYKARLEQIEGVSDSLWLDDVLDYRIPLESADPEIVENYYKDNSALIHLTIDEGKELNATTQILELIGQENSLSGVAVERASAQKMAGSEVTNAMLILIPVIVFILLISTKSWFEPILLLSSLAVAVVINMGTNIFFGEISFITRAVSSILQLAVSFDYAIFLLHSFDYYRSRTDNIMSAMEQAIKKSFSAIAASAATTLFGFVALAFMEFEIGADLGLNLVKGVLISFATIMLFLPALTLISYKLTDKTKHKKLLPDFEKLGGLVYRLRIPAVLIIILIVAPSFLAQRNNVFIYGSGTVAEHARIGRDTMAINEKFGESTALVLLVPRENGAREMLLSNELGAMENVTQVVSYSTMVGTSIPKAFLDDNVLSRFVSENYSRLVVYTDTESEGQEAFALVDEIKSVATQYFGDDLYISGHTAALRDLKAVVTRDNFVVSVLAISAIFIVLLLTFKSISLPLILVVTIQSAIWINLAVPYFVDVPLIYIGFLVISTVQLGATVDYAILLTTHYTANRKLYNKKEALYLALKDSFGSILVSGSILALSGFTLWFTSTNPIVSEMGMLLGRGTLLSMFMVVFFLPASLTLFDKFIYKTTLQSNFLKGEDNNEEINKTQKKYQVQHNS